MKRKRKSMYKGSFTIEAGILIPICIFLLVGVIEIGIGLFWDSATRKPMYKLEELEAVEYFYRVQKVKDLGEVWGKDGTTGDI